MAATYEYEPLDSARKEIRILEFDDVTLVQADEPLRCEVRIVSLLHLDVEFDAISYSWGSARSSHFIQIRDGLVSVGRNTELALRYLHAEARQQSDGRRRIWIDAVCINQQNVDERSSQVRIMADIYYKAHQVLAFLGPPQAWTSNAFATLRAVCAHAFSNTAGPMDLHSLFTTVTYDTTRLPPNMDIRSLVEFFESPWYHLSASGACFSDG